MKMKLYLLQYQLMKSIVTIFISIFMVAGISSGCRKKSIDAENNFSYQIGLKKYNYSYLGTPGYWLSIEAKIVDGGLYIYANNTSKSYNTLNIRLTNGVNNLPKDYYAAPEGQFWVTMGHYKQKSDNFYILDSRDKDAYIKFDHVSEEYVEGTFDLTLVKSDQDNFANIDPNKTIHLKKGKFKIQIH